MHFNIIESALHGHLKEHSSTLSWGINICVDLHLNKKRDLKRTMKIIFLTKKNI